MRCFLDYNGDVLIMLNTVLLILFSIIASLLSFYLVYGVVTKKASKIAFALAVVIEIVVLIAIITKNIVYFSFLGVIGVVLVIISDFKKKDR